MLTTLRAELVKLYKRPAVWVCALVLVALVVSLGYALGYVIFTFTQPPRAGGGGPQPPPYELLKQTLYPHNLIRQSLGGGAPIGGAVGLIIGVLSMGSEYGWGTLKTLLTQRPRRLEILGVKLVAIAIAQLVVVLLFYGSAAAASGIIALLDRHALDYPGPGDLLKAIGAAELIFMFWTVFGMALAVLFRQSALAIGLGLVYALVVEGLIFGILRGLARETYQAVAQWFPGANASALVQSFGEAVTLPETTKPIADPTHAMVVLALYTATCIAVAAVLLQRRDVT